MHVPLSFLFLSLYSWLSRTLPLIILVLRLALGVKIQDSVPLCLSNLDWKQKAEFPKRGNRRGLMGGGTQVSLCPSGLKDGSWVTHSVQNTSLEKLGEQGPRELWVPGITWLRVLSDLEEFCF